MSDKTQKNPDYINAPYRVSGVWYDFKKGKWVSFEWKDMKYKGRKPKQNPSNKHG